MFVHLWGNTSSANSIANIFVYSAHREEIEQQTTSTSTLQLSSHLHFFFLLG